MTCVIFCAGPFRAKTQWEIAENVREMERIAFEVCKAGAMPLVPHANTQHFNGSFSDDFFLQGTLELLRRCDGVVFHPRWKESEGCIGEQIKSEYLHMPAYYLNRIDNCYDALKRWINSYVLNMAIGVRCEFFRRPISFEF